jgi:quercetin dioxygenase-like cupin family protein
VWGAASDDLNATMLEWAAGAGPGEHVSDRDVAYVVVAGSATLTIEGEPHELAAGEALIVEKGRRRVLLAGADGVRYATVHVRRGPLQLR